MARRATIVELVEKRAKLEKRVLRWARKSGGGQTTSHFGRLDNACILLVDCDRQIADLERAARRAIKRMSR